MTSKHSWRLYPTGQTPSGINYVQDAETGQPLGHVMALGGPSGYLGVGYPSWEDNDGWVTAPNADDRYQEVFATADQAAEGVYGWHSDDGWNEVSY